MRAIVGAHGHGSCSSLQLKSHENHGWRASAGERVLRRERRCASLSEQIVDDFMPQVVIDTVAEKIFDVPAGIKKAGQKVAGLGNVTLR